MNKNNFLLIILLVIIIALLVFIVLKPKNGAVNISPNSVVVPNSKDTTINNQSKENPVQTPTSKKAEVKVYAEKDTTGDIIVGSSGEQMNVIASSNIPATISYTIKYYSHSSGVGSTTKEINQAATVSVNPGLTRLLTTTADNAKIDITFTYVDNSNKPASQIYPAIVTDTTLTFEQDAPPIEEFTSNSPKKYYHLISRSNAKKSVTYTITYTDPINQQQKIINKTVTVPLGKAELEKFTSYGEATLNYSVK